MFDEYKNHKHKLKDICLKGPQNGFYRKGAELNGTIPIMKMKQLFGFESMSEADNYELVSLTEKELERFLLTDNDLLFGRRSLVVEGAGKCKRVGKLKDKAVFESSMLRVTLDPIKIRPRYLQIWFDLDEGKKTIESIRAVTTIAGIKGSDLANVFVPIAPIELQDKFLSFVEQSDKSKFEIKNAIRKSDDMLVSIMKEFYNN